MLPFSSLPSLLLESESNKKIFAPAHSSKDHSEAIKTAQSSSAILSETSNSTASITSVKEAEDTGGAQGVTQVASLALPPESATFASLSTSDTKETQAVQSSSEIRSVASSSSVSVMSAKSSEKSESIERFLQTTAMASGASSGSSATLSIPDAKEVKEVPSFSLTSGEKSLWITQEALNKKIDSLLQKVRENTITSLDLSPAHFGQYCEYEERCHDTCHHKEGIGYLAAFANGSFASGGGKSDSTIQMWSIADVCDCRSLHSPLVFRTHTDGITALVALPNGNLASASKDKVIKLWDTTRGTCLLTLTGHQAAVNCLAVLPDGSLISGSSDSTIKHWNMTNRRCLATLEGHTEGVFALTALPNGTAASGSNDGTIKVWGFSKGGWCLFTLKGHESRVNSLLALSDNTLVSASSDKTIKVWDIAKEACLSTLSGHKGSVRALGVLPNGIVISGAMDNTIKLWDINKQSCLTTIKEHQSAVSSLVVLPNGTFVSASKDQNVKNWNIKVASLSAQQVILFLKELKRNTSVIQLDLSGNLQVSDVIIDDLVSVFKPGFFSHRQPNKRIKLIDVRRTKMTKHGVEKLGRKIGDVIILSDFLNPEGLSKAQRLAQMKMELEAKHQKETKDTDQQKKQQRNEPLAVEKKEEKLGHVTKGKVNEEPKKPVNQGMESVQKSVKQQGQEKAREKAEEEAKRVKDHLEREANKMRRAKERAEQIRKEQLMKEAKEKQEHIEQTQRKIEEETRQVQKQTEVEKAQKVEKANQANRAKEEKGKQVDAGKDEKEIPVKQAKEEKEKIANADKVSVEKERHSELDGLRLQLLKEEEEQTKMQKALEEEEERSKARELEKEIQRLQAELLKVRNRRPASKDSIDSKEQALKVEVSPLASGSLLGSSPGSRSSLYGSRNSRSSFNSTSGSTLGIINQMTEAEVKEMQATYLLPYSSLVFGDVLGKGAFGVVFKGTYRLGEVAIKRLLVEKMTESGEEEFKNEISIMARSKHPNIVTLYGYTVSPSPYCIVMERMHTSLYHVLHHMTVEELPFDTKKVIAMDMIAGLLQLHELGILHRDLKSLNVLLSSTMRAKLADFGLSKLKSEAKTTVKTAADEEDVVGTVQWMAPELFGLKPKYTKSSDIFAYGMVLWELATHQVPYADANQQVVIVEVSSGNREEIPNECPLKFASLIRSCWAQDPAMRPSAQEIGEYLQSREEEFKPAIVKETQYRNRSGTTDSRVDAAQPIQVTITEIPYDDNLSSQGPGNLSSLRM